MIPKLRYYVSYLSCLKPAKPPWDQNALKFPPVLRQ